jgi:hypothetical protein
MKYYNIELLQNAAEKLQQLLYDLQIKFEISAAGAYYHFEILLNKNSVEFNKINDFLLSDAITEV